MPIFTPPRAQAGYPAYPAAPSTGFGTPPLRPRRTAPVPLSQAQSYAPQFDEKAHATKLSEFTNKGFNDWYSKADLTPFVQPNDVSGASTPRLRTGISITKGDGTTVSSQEQHDPTNLNDPAVAAIARQNARTHYLRNVLPQDEKYQALQAQAVLARQQQGMPIAPPLKPNEQLARERFEFEKTKAGASQSQKNLETIGKGVAGVVDRIGSVGKFAAEQVNKQRTQAETERHNRAMESKTSGVSDKGLTQSQRDERALLRMQMMDAKTAMEAGEPDALPRLKQNYEKAKNSYVEHFKNPNAQPNVAPSTPASPAAQPTLGGQSLQAGPPATLAPAPSTPVQSNPTTQTSKSGRPMFQHTDGAWYYTQ